MKHVQRTLVVTCHINAHMYVVMVTRTTTLTNRSTSTKGEWLPQLQQHFKYD